MLTPAPKLKDTSVDPYLLSFIVLTNKHSCFTNEKTSRWMKNPLNIREGKILCPEEGVVHVLRSVNISVFDEAPELFHSRYM